MKIDRHSALHVFAGWNTNRPESLKSASGGTAWLLGKYYIETLGGVVYATAFTAAKGACVIRATTLQDLEATKGSRYVRSAFPQEMFEALLEDLAAGRPVLFVGTPCQVAGVRGKVEKRFPVKPGMTGERGMAGEKGMTGAKGLLCVDLLCHGAPPRSYLEAEIRHLIGDKPYTDIRFRGNDGHDFHLSIWDGEHCLYSVEARKQPYLLAMLRGVNLMEGCYKCPFATPERVGDITLGDYIGLGAKDGFKVEGHNVSYIGINTPQGESAYRAFCAETPAFQSVERPVEERLAYRPSILEPTLRHPLRDAFRQRLPHLGCPRSIRRTMRGEILHETPLYRTLHHWAHILLRHRHTLDGEVPGKNPPKGAEP
ncbi:MAG: Coenzyme F420 hydrogenase/dehydrogenase, beta subunit C-terminal domain [Bacteroidales bacterium]|nr:Coenzyme F420 hydrogenase/dehydrogenase, beta subunit C-terminal domain [Bacteroidales bacterium]